MSLAKMIVNVWLLFAYSSNTLNVKAYGATGNGVTDDTNAINSCLAAAASGHKNVYFPNGTYLCNNENSSGEILQYAAAGNNNITIYGQSQSGTIITTSKDTSDALFYIYAFGADTNLCISKITFQSTHHNTVVGQTSAIYMTGTSSQNIVNTYLNNCTFSGFSNAVIAQGINGWQIRNNIFVSPNGHYNAQPNNQPAVYIWFADNANGYCKNVDVEDNYATGYSGSYPINCPRPLDGFIYGDGYGMTVQNNTLTTFSQEFIYFLPQTTFPTTTSTVLIKGNTLDCTLPVGCVDSNGSAHKYTYGIRSESNNTTITYNTIKNYTSGILVRGVAFPTVSTFTTFVIQNNELNAAVDTSLYNLGQAIFVQGSTSFPIPGVNVQNNNIYGTDTVAVQILNAVTPLNINNNPRVTRLP